MMSKCGESNYSSLIPELELLPTRSTEQKLQISSGFLLKGTFPAQTADGEQWRLKLWTSRLRNGLSEQQAAPPLSKWHFH